MRLSPEQIIADRARMEQFISERIPPDGARIDLGGGAWADLTPFWDERFGWSLLLETDEPEWVDLRMVYEHFRRQEMTNREWWTELEGEMAWARVRSLEGEVAGLGLTAMTPASSENLEPGLPSEKKAMVTVREVAALLSCSYGEARKRMLEGRIRAVKDGRWMRTRPEWVEEYVARVTITPAETPATIHEVPVPSRRKTPAKVKASGIGYRFLKNRAK
jgi:excisionase family DNA binding protein